MELTISASQGMVNIDTKATDNRFAFAFGLIADMYLTGAGVGCQVNDEALRQDIQTMCLKIADALQEFGLKHPETEILDASSRQALITANQESV